MSINMQIIEIVSEKKGRVTISLDNGLSFPLYQKEAAGYHLEEGKELPMKEWIRIRTEVLDKRAKKRAMYLLQKMDRTEYQLRKKLEENGYPQEVVESAVDYVKSYHYIDDFRYASAYVRCRQGQKSRLQLKAALQQKGVSGEVIARALEEAYVEGEEGLIRKLLEKKHYDSENMEQKEKYKIYQYLMRKGFAGETVRHLMKM